MYSTGLTYSTCGPYALMGSQYGAWAFTGAFGMAMLPGEASCAGVITATFTWNNGGDPAKTPPPGVLVKESCSASWSGNWGSCDNGLGHPVVPGSSSASSSGDRYRFIANPGASFTVTCSPSSSTSAWLPPLMGGSATVSYSAAALPVDISLTGGAMVDGVRSYLVGQMCKAALVTSPDAPPVLLSGITPAWSYSGGDPFGGWLASETSATMVALGPLVNTTTVGCYYRSPDPGATVSVSAAFVIPAGALPSATLPFSVTKSVVVVAPTIWTRIVPPQDALSTELISGWPANGVAITAVPPPLQVQFGGLECPGFYAVGVKVQARVTTPQQFAQSTGLPHQWNYVQRVTMGRTRTRLLPIGDPVQERVRLNGIPVLDTQYPLEPGPAYGVVWGFTPDGVEHPVGDAPSMWLATDLTMVQIADQFTIWVMYRPPSPDPSLTSAYTPLRCANWNWSVRATKVASTWQLDTSASGHGPFAPGPHPTWSVCAKGDLDWDPVL